MGSLSRKRGVAVPLLGLGMIAGAAILGAAWLLRSSSSSTSGFTPAQRRHARHVRQWAKWAGKDISEKPQTAERVLPNGMTRSYAKKYLAYLNERQARLGTRYTYKHISPNSMALPVGEAVR